MREQILNLEAKQAIKKLVQQTNHQLSVDDFEDILELNELANQLSNIIDFEGKLLPIYLTGDILIYPPTISKLIILEEFANKFESNIMQLSFFAYILSLPNKQEYIIETIHFDKLKSKVKAFGSKLDIGEDELMDKINEVMPRNTGGGKASGQLKSLLSILCRATGQSPDYWLYEADVNLIHQIVADYIKDIERQHSIFGQKTGSSNITMKYLFNFRMKVKEIKEKWSNHG
jgi:hypothetical protein